MDTSQGLVGEEPACVLEGEEGEEPRDCLGEAAEVMTMEAVLSS